LRFAPGTALLQCGYCGGVDPITAADAPIVERDYHKVLQGLSAGAETTSHRTLKCTSCAAESTFPDIKVATACPFCGADIVATRQASRQIKPAALLPFKVTRDEANAAFKSWLKGRWFAPNALRRAGRTRDRLAGMYVPYWTYDSRVVTHYTGQRGQHYWVTVGSGKNRRRVRKTRWYPTSGTVQNNFDDVLVMASHSLPHRYAERLEPWDLDDLVPYADDYLSGFGAECYQVDLEAGFVMARGIMAPHIEHTIRQDIGGDAQRVSSASSEYFEISFKHILLPVWISAYRFKQKVYRFLVNARTAEVQGERPWSWIKIALASLVGVAVVAAGILLSK
jgi:predicted RNA-binding Zn-ribbon protein involved in translation (DUF1610 family)